MFSLTNHRVASLLVAMGLILVLAPLAQASSFSFGGSADGKGVHLHSRGRINFDWTPITSTDPAGDPLLGNYFGASDMRIWDALAGNPAFTGVSNVSVGDSFTGLDYSVSFWVVSPGERTNIQATREKRPRAKNTLFGGALTLTSISFPSDYSIILSGTLTGSIDHLIGSTVVDDIMGAGGAAFSIALTATDKTAMPFLTALKSEELSDWADYGGASGGVTTAVPEPGTLGLLATALIGSVGIIRRRKKETDQAA